MRKLRYQALGPLLAGEGSRAFLGLEISNETKARPVVLVWVPPEANSDPNLLERIRRETQHAATLEHPNIVRVHCFAQLEEGYARVVEFADGESVRRILEVTHALPARFAAKIAADAAMGVHYAHMAGNDDGAPLMHGDIRPETLLVSFAGTCKVAGYGALAVAPNDPGGKRVRGRRLHCAPEQVVGGREAMVLQTDVYLLGLTLYECLTGKVPFENAADLDQAILAGLPPTIESKDVPAALKEVVIRAMAKKAPDRFPTPLAFKEAVEGAMGRLPSNHELATYLLDFFPQAEDARAARRRVIDAGIAEFARKQWEMAPSGRMPALSSQAIASATAPSAPQPPPAAPKPAAAAPKAPAAAPRPAPSRAQEEEDEPPPRQKTRPSVVVIGSIAVAVLAVIWAMTRGEEAPAPVAPQPVAAAPLPVPVPVPSEPADAGEDGGAALAVSPVDAGGPEPLVQAPPAEEPTSLELIVQPAVNITIDGKPAGRSPLHLPLSPGKHLVKLTDKEKGISTSRTVWVGPKGKTSEEVFLGKGMVSVNAPEGAVIYVDGQRMGYAPMKEVPVWEGLHLIRVTVGKAEWKQAFSVRANERQYFNVETE